METKFSLFITLLIMCIETCKVHAFKGAKHEHLKLAIRATKRAVYLPGKVCTK